MFLPGVAKHQPDIPYLPHGNLHFRPQIRHAGELEKAPSTIQAF